MGYSWGRYASRTNRPSNENAQVRFLYEFHNLGYGGYPTQATPLLPCCVYVPHHGTSVRRHASKLQVGLAISSMSYYMLHSRI